MKKIKIAFIKYAGLTSGGSEKLLQIIAANLPKERFDVTYFYCDPSPYTGGYQPQGKTDFFRYEYMKNAGVRLVKFSVKEKDITTPTHTWKATDFFEVFKEDDFDLIQTCRSGHKEYPFTKIRRKPIIDIIALSSGSDNQYNIARVLHLSSFSANQWVSRGGDRKRIVNVSLPIVISDDTGENFINEFNLGDKFVFGMHQRDNDGIFSPIPLLAYSEIETESTAFFMLGGSVLYKEQAKKLHLKNVYFLDATGDSKIIFKFLRTLSVYAHGRKDGEINSQALAEAMFTGLPIVSHVSSINNGHIEGIGLAGAVTANVDEYKTELKKLLYDKEYFEFRKRNSFLQFKNNYELGAQIEKYVNIYEDVYRNPFPGHFRRILTSLHYTQNIRLIAVYFYLKLKFLFN